MPDPTAPLSDRIALITGASRGIGRAVAIRLAQAGAQPVLAARTHDALRAVADTIHGMGSVAHILPTDLTDDQQIEALIETILHQYGRVDILINNAGGGPPRTHIVKARAVDWQWTLQLNLWATMLLTKLVLPSMLHRRQGTIINMCSLAGMAGKAGEAVYAAAKFGVRGFTQSLFEEVREHNIKVATIYPGYVDTTLIPPNRRIDRDKMLRAEDVAETVYMVATAPVHCCPVEIVLQSQQDPVKP